MDPGSPVLEDLGFLDLFGSQEKQHSMDLDTGLSGVSLPELDEAGLALHLDPSMRRFPGMLGACREGLVGYLPHTVAFASMQRQGACSNVLLLAGLLRLIIPLTSTSLLRHLRHFALHISSSTRCGLGSPALPARHRDSAFVGL